MLEFYTFPSSPFLIFDIFVNCNWVATGWQYTFTHKQYTERHETKIQNSQRKSNKMQQCIRIFISYLYEAQHVSGDTSPIIGSLKLHQRPLVLNTQRVVGHVVAGWVAVLHETCKAVSRYSKLYNGAFCWMYIGIFLRCADP